MCVFCQIVARAVPASVVYDDESVMALMTIKPFNPGHTLVITKKHFTRLEDLDEETGTHLFRIAKRAAHAIRNSGVRCEGVNLYMADENQARKSSTCISMSSQGSEETGSVWNQLEMLNRRAMSLIG